MSVFLILKIWFTPTGVHMVWVCRTATSTPPIHTVLYPLSHTVPDEKYTMGLLNAGHSPGLGLEQDPA